MLASAEDRRNGLIILIACHFSFSHVLYSVIILLQVFDFSGAVNLKNTAVNGNVISSTAKHDMLVNNL